MKNPMIMRMNWPVKLTLLKKETLIANHSKTVMKEKKSKTLLLLMRFQECRLLLEKMEPPDGRNELVRTSCFYKAFGRVATVEKATKGFEVTRIFPVNRDVFTAEDFAPAENLKPTNSSEAIPRNEQIEENRTEEREEEIRQQGIDADTNEIETRQLLMSGAAATPIRQWKYQKQMDFPMPYMANRARESNLDIDGTQSSEETRNNTDIEDVECPSTEVDDTDIESQNA
ncbi:hypothetical protein JTB14_032451 [Gonioctena quinquepunctata]|nr:hypothetical protein JTB14_032451 [Gonioctena quinquepunctata]